MRKTIIFMLALLLCVGFIAESGEAAAITNISMAKSSISLRVGQTATLKANISPDSARGQQVGWTSSNGSVLSSVGAGGDILVPMSFTDEISVRAVSEGSTRVTCYSVANPSISASMMVYVGNDYINEDYEEEGGGCSTFGLGFGILALAGLLLLRKRSGR